jgi:membrane protein DedA with SNARE-associated domain
VRRAVSNVDTLFIVAALLFVGWICYWVGKRVGISKMRKAADLEKQAELSTKQVEDQDH